MIGYTGFLAKHGPYTFLSVYFAENMGLFSRFRYNIMTYAGTNDTGMTFV